MKVQFQCQSSGALMEEITAKYCVVVKYAGTFTGIYTSTIYFLNCPTRMPPNNQQFNFISLSHYTTRGKIDSEI